MELFWPGRGHVVNSGFDASLVGMRDRRRMQFLGKRRTPGALKWRSSKSLDSQEQTHTHEVLTKNRVCHRLCTQKGTQVSEIFVTAKPGVYPQGDAKGGILEL